jgi:hypothetical protein
MCGGKDEKLTADNIFFYTNVEKFIQDLIPHEKKFFFKQREQGESISSHAAREILRLK